MKTLFIFIALLFSSTAFGYQHLAVGQGVSAPHQGLGTFFTNGFTNENSFAAAQLNKTRITAGYAEGENDTSNIGAEFAYGNGNAGFQAGYLARDCTNCEDDFRANLAIQFAGIGFGVGFKEDLYSLSFLLNPDGQHRIGFVGESYQDADNSANEFFNVGVGYAFYSNNFVFSLDASKREYDTSLVNDDRVIVSPGLLVPFQSFSVSVTHDINVDLPENSDKKDETWFGIALHPQNNFSVGVYSDFYGEWNANVSLLF
ncbi:MAG: hypothetical protein MK008_09850 [Bdellovibrionales bacterium]|nr:hypothetical protein [Bdellovibrionales bacterium]